ncbi:hypothetical protein ACE3MQ_09230 [Paenibacillus lentus]|uniref:hypothetical protein n=1 Tax=Paenibacillus lentus TaxID=1338368 RepID=UPI003664FC97
MPDLVTQLQYNDPLTIIFRKGTDDDPYKDRSDSLPVVNGIITLFEIPSLRDRVQISGMVEIDQEIYERRKELKENEFLVHYSIGIIQFHPKHEGTIVLCRYKGRGLIMYPASRIYALVRRNPDVVITLQDYIEEIEIKIKENTSLIKRVEDLISETRIVIDESQKATDNANRAAQEADLARDLALDAYETTRLVWKEPVDREQDIYTTYPHPSVGWVVQTTRDGKRYRFDGNHWVLIDIFGSNLQVVTEHKDGLMSVAEHLKLKSFPVELKDRIIVFCLADLAQGIQDLPFTPFPFKGEIVAVDGFCISAGETRTELSIEKSRNLINWTEITSRRMRFESDSHMDDKGIVLTSNEVEPGDFFRINVTNLGIGINNATITMRIKI